MYQFTPDSVAGSLIGLALGDALGAVVEARPVTEARAYVDEWLRRQRGGERGRVPFAFGQVTDDTQLAVALLGSITEHGSFDPGVFARYLIRAACDDGLVGGGPGSAGAAERLRAGVPWQEAGAPPLYAGNGAAMRVGPLGTLYADDGELKRIAALQSRVTHRDPRSAAGAVAVAMAVHIAARNESITASDFLVSVADAAGELDGSVSETIAAMEEWVGLPPMEATDWMTRKAIEPTAHEGWRGVSSFVTSSVCWSLYAFLRSPDDYWESVCTAIWVGGDTDTTAAMTGSITGGRVGFHALPHLLFQRLTDRGRWNSENLVAVAESCHRAMAPRPTA